MKSVVKSPYIHLTDIECTAGKVKGRCEESLLFRPYHAVFMQEYPAIYGSVLFPAIQTKAYVINYVQIDMCCFRERSILIVFVKC